MPLEQSKVLQCRRPDRATFIQRVAEDWQRAFPPQVRGTAADVIGCHRKTIDNAVAGNHLPDSYTLLMALLADPTALQSALASIGFKIAPLRAEAANDLQTVSNISHLAGQWTEALADGKRDHVETCSLADRIRPLLPALLAIVAEADRHKAA